MMSKPKLEELINDIEKADSKENLVEKTNAATLAICAYINENYAKSGGMLSRFKSVFSGSAVETETIVRQMNELFSNVIKENHTDNKMQGMNNPGFTLDSPSRNAYKISIGKAMLKTSTTGAIDVYQYILLAFDKFNAAYYKIKSKEALKTVEEQKKEIETLKTKAPSKEIALIEGKNEELSKQIVFLQQSNVQMQQIFSKESMKLFGKIEQLTLRLEEMENAKKGESMEGKQSNTFGGNGFFQQTGSEKKTSILSRKDLVTQLVAYICENFDGEGPLNEIMPIVQVFFQKETGTAETTVTMCDEIISNFDIEKVTSLQSVNLGDWIRKSIPQNFEKLLPLDVTKDCMSMLSDTENFPRVPEEAKEDPSPQQAKHENRRWVLKEVIKRGTYKSDVMNPTNDNLFRTPTTNKRN